MLHTPSDPALLVINSGSSSLKFLVIVMNVQQDNLSQTPGQNLYRGQIDSIGGDDGFQVSDGNEQLVHKQAVSVVDHAQAIQILLDWLSKEAASLNIIAAGHRVVHGGTRFHQPVLVTAEVNERGSDHHNHTQISQTDSPVQVWVINTDEERMIAEHSFHLFSQHRQETSL